MAKKRICAFHFFLYSNEASKKYQGFDICFEHGFSCSLICFLGFVAACGSDTSRNLIRGNLNSQLVAFIEVVFSATS